MKKEKKAPVRGAGWKWLLGIVAVLVLLAAAAYVVVFRINQFLRCNPPQTDNDFRLNQCNSLTLLL